MTTNHLRMGIHSTLKNTVHVIHVYHRKYTIYSKMCEQLIHHSYNPFENHCNLDHTLMPVINRCSSVQLTIFAQRNLALKTAASMSYHNHTNLQCVHKTKISESSNITFTAIRLCDATTNICSANSD